MMSGILKFALICSLSMFVNGSGSHGGGHGKKKKTTRTPLKCNDPVKGFEPYNCDGYPHPDAFNEDANCRGRKCKAEHCCKWGGACMDGPCTEGCDVDYVCKLGYFE